MLNSKILEYNKINLFLFHDKYVKKSINTYNMNKNSNG